MLSRISTRAPGLSFRRIRYRSPLSSVPKVIAGSMSASTGSPSGSGATIGVDEPSLTVGVPPGVAVLSGGSVVSVSSVDGVELLDSWVTPDDEVHAATRRQVATPKAVDRGTERRRDGPERAPNMMRRLDPASLSSVKRHQSHARRAGDSNPRQTTSRGFAAP